MNIKQFFLFVGLVFPAALFANQHQPSVISPLADQSLLSDITQVNGRLIAVGERGHILTSDDGSQWQQSEAPVSVLLTAVTAVGDSVCDVGHDATIIHSVDGGRNWVIQYSDFSVDKPLLDIVFFDQQHGVAIGAYGMYLRTRDGGKSWVSEIHTELLFEEDREYLEELKEESIEDYELELESILPHFNQIAVSDNTLIMVGEMGLVAQSTDFGVTWNKLEVDYEGSFFTVNVFDNQTILGGLRGTVFERKRVGAEFERVRTKAKASFNGVFSANGVTYIVGNNGHVVSLSGGQVSEHQIPEEKAILNGVHFNGQFVLATDIGVLQSKNISK